MVQRGEQRGADVNIEDANILVAGGRGLGKAEGFEALEALANALGGAVAATRAVVDAGWYSYSAQIGQTGKTVAPKLYLAAGHLRRDPAQGRHAGLREHRGHQQGLQRPDLRVLRPRHRRRSQQDRPEADRGREGQEGLVRMSAAPSQFPPPVDSAKEFVGPPTDARGRADRGRRRDRRRRPGRPRLRDPPAAAARGRPGAHRAPRRGAGGGHREGPRRRGAPALRRRDEPVARSASCCPTTTRGRTTARSSARRSTSCSTASARCR